MNFLYFETQTLIICKTNVCYDDKYFFFNLKLKIQYFLLLHCVYKQTFFLSLNINICILFIQVIKITQRNT